MSLCGRRWTVVAVALGLAAGWAPRARATSPSLFGLGPRSSALAQSDVADASPGTAAYGNPARLAARGTRVSVGYGRGWTHLELDGVLAPVRDVRGFDIAGQTAVEVSGDVAIGAGAALHVPDVSLARVSFQPGTELLLVRYEPAAQRMTADLAVAVRYRQLSVGAGAAVLMNAAGDGVRLALGQDGNGTYADGAADVTMPYHLAPIAGVAVDLGPAGLGARFRGAHSVDLELATQADVIVTGNPLNGTTVVRVRGASGYVPATLDLGARWDAARWLRAMLSLQYARWSAAPSPAAELSMDVGLGMVPGQIEGKFVEPRMRDTLSPRLGLELAPSGALSRVAMRAGWAYWPSPVPRQTGFASHADAPVHVLSGGAGVDLGTGWGVAMRADGALQLGLLEQRRFDKPSEVLPYAHYTVDGFLLYGGVAVQGAWR